METNENKLRLIRKIDQIKRELYHQLTQSQDKKLESLRDKYIYKDISRAEYKEDKSVLYKIDNDIKWSYFNEVESWRNSHEENQV